jgi:hypothetical protein
MKSLRFALSFAALASATFAAQPAFAQAENQLLVAPITSETELYALGAGASAQGEAAKPQSGHDHTQAATTQALTDAQKAFTAMKTFGGVWEGDVTISPSFKGAEKAPLRVNLRVLSHGNSIAHDMKGLGEPEDPTKYDHPITMIYLDNGELNLVHYCDAGNRPHMTGKLSDDGKTVEFTFRDLTGPTERGNMYHARFTAIDADHHIEEWTYMMPGNKPMVARMELHRVADTATTASAR